MKVLFLAAEAAPLAKVGGLGDVAGELPRALTRAGVDVRVCLPLYPMIDRAGLQLRQLGQAGVGEWEAELYAGEIAGLPAFLIDGQPIQTTQSIYASPAEDGVRFAFFSLGCLAACERSGWQPDLVHANDWHTAPAVLWLKQRRAGIPFWSKAVTLLTVHNLPYMGAGAEAALDLFGLKPAQDESLPAWARSMPLPAGMAAADWISTVSPGYAEEIQGEEFGCGLEGFLLARKDRLVGILNGIDPQEWDPASDPHLHSRFSRDELELRQANKRRLQAELDLPRSERALLIGMVTRLALQKGTDLAFEALGQVEDLDWQLVLLGSGETEQEDLARQFGSQQHRRARALLRFDPALARRIYASVDLLLMPSRYEPCGLTQMIAMRYGCVPLARATGGLRDTVSDYRSGAGSTGFLFSPIESQALADALRRAFGVYADKRRWRGLQRRGMARDFSWGRSAQAYRQLYRRAVGVHPN